MTRSKKDHDKPADADNDRKQEAYEPEAKPKNDAPDPGKPLKPKGQYDPDTPTHPKRPDDRPDPVTPGTPDRPGRPQQPRPPRIDLTDIRPATPYLVTRSFSSDLGVRPIAPADTGSIAYSPDIPLVPESNPDGSLVLSCWVSNMGFAPAAPAQIEFFLMPPSITQPAPAPFLVATEYAVIEPHTSKLIRSRPLTFPNPFGGGLAEGVLVRVSTPFDRAGDGLDPVLDRHVAMMNAWPITDTQPSVDFGITNWLDRPTTANIDVVFDHLRLANPESDTPVVRQPYVLNDLLTVDVTEPDVAVQVDRASRNRAVSARTARVLRAALNGPRAGRAGLARRVSSLSAGASVDVTLTPLETRRKLFPNATTRTRQALTCLEEPRPPALPSGRRCLAEGLDLNALEERRLQLSIGPRPQGRPGDYDVVHLFHLDAERKSLLGRLSFVLPHPMTTHVSGTSSATESLVTTSV